MGKSKYKKWAGYIAAVLFSIVLLACGSQNVGKQDTENSGANQDTKEEKQETIVLTYGYIDSNNFEDLKSSVQERIVAFNKSQSEYFIEVVKYGNDSYIDGLKALNTDLAAGKGPDIIELPNDILLHQFGEKGTIEDLYPYIDNEEGVKREEFVENILPWFETGGKLYGLTPFFKLLSIFGNPNYFQGEQITFHEFKELYESNINNEDITVYNALDKYFILQHCITYSIESFVNMETYSCNFMDEKFKELLEFSNQFDVQEYLQTNAVDNMIKLQENKMILYYSGVIGSFREYTHFRELLGVDGTLIGFPSIEGCTPVITTNFPFLTINSKSKNKEIAWEFINTFMDLKYLTSNDNVDQQEGFPITKMGFDAMGEKLIKTTEGVKGEGSTEDLKGAMIVYTVLPTTKGDVDYIKQTIRKAIPPSENYDEIKAIIEEEIPSYWSGSKTAEQIMEIIQSRAQLYLDEIK